MYGSTTKAQDGRGLEQAACYVLVGTAIAFGVARFWKLDLPAGIMLTPAFGALSLLLSKVAVRIEQAARAHAWATLAVVALLGVVCGSFEAAMTHAGLEWLNSREAIAPDAAIWPASIGLSLFNIGASWAFVRPIPEARRQAPKARQLPPPVVAPAPDAGQAGRDPETDRILSMFRDGRGLGQRAA